RARRPAHVILVGELGQQGLDAWPHGRVLDAVVGLEDDPYGVTRLLWEAGLQQVVGGDGVRAGELGAVGISAVQRLTQEPEGEEGDDPENENETAAVEAPAGESFEHRRSVLCSWRGQRE